MKSCAIVANGFADGPAQALRDYLVERGLDVVTVFHPLTPEQGRAHLVTTYDSGRPAKTRTIRLPLRPPLSYAADPLVPLRMPAVDVWFGFNPLACTRGLAARRLGKAGRVVLWSVDFVPNRFGSRSPLTVLYERLDRLSCTRADGRVELSEAALVARDRHHRLESSATPVVVTPMGAWLGRTPQSADDGWSRRRVVYLGHLVPRQGVATLLAALALLDERGEGVSADVIGAGPDEAALREQVRSLGLVNVVRMHGFVPDHRSVERLLAEASLGIAPYEPSGDTFTRHADPGKLKAYLAAGLPIVLTDVPPNAKELSEEAGAMVVPHDPAAIADAIAASLASPERWRERRSAALRYVSRFDWATLLPATLRELGIELG